MALKISPSTAHLWVMCSAAAGMRVKYPREYFDGESAEEGTAAHEVLAAEVNGSPFKPGTETAKGHMVDQDMIDHARDCAEIVPRTGSVLVERKVNLSAIYPALEGTPDIAWYDEDDGTVTIVDYKYGHAPVEAEENWQLLCYCAGFLEHVPSAFNLIVYQPRSYREEPCKTWSVTYDQYVGHYLPLLQAAAREAEDGPAQARTGGQCGTCSGARACQALRDAALTAVDISRSGYERELEPEAAASELTLLRAAQSRLDARLKALEEQAVDLIRNGTPVPGYAVEPRYGRRSWRIPPESLFAAGDAFGIDLRKPPQAITPAQAIKAGLDKNAVMANSYSPLIGVKLEPVNLKGVFKND